MESASVLAIVSGICWAINITIVKWALNRSRASALVGATVGVSIAAIVSLTLALLSGSDFPDSDVIWKFAIVGMIAPAVHKDYLCRRSVPLGLRAHPYLLEPHQFSPFF